MMEDVYFNFTGPGFTNDDADHYPGPSLITDDDDVIMGDNTHEVYGLSQLCHSGSLAKHVQQFGQQWWGLNDMRCFVNDWESDEEE